MNKLIFIGGATATGKSSLVKELNTFYSYSTSYRRVQGFYDLAMLKGVPIDKAFEIITPQEVDKNLISICKQNELVFSDVHYAVQMNRKNNIDVNEKYVPTISQFLIQNLKENEIEIIPVLLECSPNTCFNRAKFRFDNGIKEMRNISLEDTEIELLSEKREFYEILKKCNKGLIINSEEMSIDELIMEIDKIIFDKKESKIKQLIRKKVQNERNNI